MTIFLRSLLSLAFFCVIAVGTLTLFSATHLLPERSAIANIQWQEGGLYRGALLVEVEVMNGKEPFLVDWSWCPGTAWNAWCVALSSDWLSASGAVLWAPGRLEGRDLIANINLNGAVSGLLDANGVLILSRYDLDMQDFSFNQLVATGKFETIKLQDVDLGEVSVSAETFDQGLLNGELVNQYLTGSLSLRRDGTLIQALRYDHQLPASIRVLSLLGLRSPGDEFKQELVLQGYGDNG